MHKKTFWTVALAILAFCAVVNISRTKTAYSQGGRPQITPEQLDKRRAIENELQSIAIVERKLMIPMRDGIKIATDIYRPFIKDEAEPAKLPILLSRTPYDKTSANAVEQAKWFAKHGYIVVLQDDRGAYKSEGVQSKYIGYVKLPVHSTASLGAPVTPLAATDCRAAGSGQAAACGTHQSHQEHRELSGVA